MMGNKAADFHKQITFLKLNKVKFNGINNALNSFSANNFAKWNDDSNKDGITQITEQ